MVYQGCYASSFSLSLDMGSIPVGTALASQVASYGIQQCKMVSVPASAGLFRAMQLFGMTTAGTPVTNVLGNISINNIALPWSIKSFVISVSTNIDDLYTTFSLDAATIASINSALQAGTYLQLNLSVTPTGGFFTMTINIVNASNPSQVIVSKTYPKVLNVSSVLSSAGVALKAPIPSENSIQFTTFSVSITPTNNKEVPKYGGLVQIIDSPALTGSGYIGLPLNFSRVSAYYTNFNNYAKQSKFSTGVVLPQSPALSFNLASALQDGIFMVIQQPQFTNNALVADSGTTATSNFSQTLNYYIYNKAGALLYSGTYPLYRNQDDNKNAIQGFKEIYYQVSPTFVFGGPVNTLFYLQSPMVNINSTNKVAAIPAASLPAATTDLGAKMAAFGLTSVIGVPLFKADMAQQDISLVLGQAASDAVFSYTLTNISKVVTSEDLIKGVYVLLNNPPLYNNNTGQSAVSSYAVFKKDGTTIPLTVNTIAYSIPTAASDMVSYIQKAVELATPTQLTPAQAVGGGMYIVGSCVGNPLLIASSAPYPQAFFLQYSTTGTVNPTVTPVAPVVPKDQATLITNVTNDVQAPVVGAAAMIQSYGSVALSNSTSPVNAYANAAITASWNVIYDLYDLLNSVAPTVASQLPKSLQRPA